MAITNAELYVSEWFSGNPPMNDAQFTVAAAEALTEPVKIGGFEPAFEPAFALVCYAGDPAKAYGVKVLYFESLNIVAKIEYRLGPPTLTLYGGDVHIQDQVTRYLSEIDPSMDGKVKNGNSHQT